MDFFLQDEDDEVFDDEDFDDEESDDEDDGRVRDPAVAILPHIAFIVHEEQERHHAERQGEGGEGQEGCEAV